MNINYFNILHQGFSGQLDELNLEDTMTHLENHLCAMLLDPYVCGAYLNRIGKDNELTKSPRGCFYFNYLFKKIVNMNIFSITIHKKYLNFFKDKNSLYIYNELEKHNHAQDTVQKISDLKIDVDSEDITKFYLELLGHFPDYAEVAQELLTVDFYCSRTPTWLNKFKCPQKLTPHWRIKLFNFYAAQGKYEIAQKIFATLENDLLDEYTLNNSAEMHVALGDIDSAKKLFALSIDKDRLQIPVRLRLNQLENPFKKKMDILSKYKICIYLYSYNKGPVLAETLESLFSSNIGKSKVRVLVNGSTDDTCSYLEEIKNKYPDMDFDFFKLPVNIGAPAARNYMIHMAETWESNFVAFMDDDILLQEDWLEWFLSVAEMDKSIGVVGCKIIEPKKPHRYQYLYRHINIAKNGLLRLSFDSPINQYDNCIYDFVVETRNVMGCLHLFRTDALRDVPEFDIRFSPSQVDDIDHDIALCLKGWKIYYCGLVSCIHKQNSGWGQFTSVDNLNLGNAIGNDVKLHYKHADRMEELEKLDNLSLKVYSDLHIFPVQARLKPEE